MLLGKELCTCLSRLEGGPHTYENKIAPEPRSATDAFGRELLLLSTNNETSAVLALITAREGFEQSGLGWRPISLSSV